MLKSILTNPTTISIISGQLRHYGSMAGAALATYGVIDGGETQTVSGIVVATGMLIWSALSKRA